MVRGATRTPARNVGAGDRIEVAVSHDAGRTFGAPIAMPADGGHSASALRLAPLDRRAGGGLLTETTGSGNQGF